jgi:hypothetical protein
MLKSRRVQHGRVNGAALLGMRIYPAVGSDEYEGILVIALLALAVNIAASWANRP